MDRALEIIEHELEGIYANKELVEKSRFSFKKRGALLYWIGQAMALERIKKLLLIYQLAKEAE